MAYLEGVSCPQDIKKLNVTELEALAGEIRAYIIEVLEKNGGHLASNLGTVELTLALHYVFDAPRDKLVFDVGHQSYTHKILTGRREAFAGIRTLGGISGFPKREESEYDTFNTGHSSTSISAGLGLARARDLAGGRYSVVSVIGDGAIGSGMAFEAMNDVGQTKTRMIIVLNDNEMSIDRNVGALSDQLARMRVSRRYLRFKSRFSRSLKRIPLFGDELERFAKRTKNAVKRLLVKGLVFEHFGLTYLGPIDGHNLKDMIDILAEAKDCEDPVLLHVVTQKGRGLAAAERRPEQYHGVSPRFAVSNPDTFSEAAGEALARLAEKNDRVCAITAAMREGTGLVGFSQHFPERFFDVGISEQHAVTFAAGLAVGGYHPFVCVYSTFLQRAYDQILHDVCLQNLPVTFLLDRAGLSGRDGETHHGIYDIAYLRHMPNIELYAPASYSELYATLEYSLTCGRPVAVRYPAGTGLALDLTFSKSWRYVEGGPDCEAVLLAAGSRMVRVARHAARDLAEEGILAGVVNCSALRPVDAAFLNAVSEKKLVVLEDGVEEGGFASAVLEHYNAAGQSVHVERFGYSGILPHGSVQELFELAGVTRENVARRVRAMLGRGGAAGTEPEQAQRGGKRKPPHGGAEKESGNAR